MTHGFELRIVIIRSFNSRANPDANFATFKILTSTPEAWKQFTKQKNLAMLLLHYTRTYLYKYIFLKCGSCGFLITDQNFFLMLVASFNGLYCSLHIKTHYLFPSSPWRSNRPVFSTHVCRLVSSTWLNRLDVERKEIKTCRRRYAILQPLAPWGYGADAITIRPRHPHYRCNIEKLNL